MRLKAKYLFIVSMDVEAEYEDLFNEVFDAEHVPNICNVPGVNAAYRLKPGRCPTEQRRSGWRQGDGATTTLYRDL